MNILREGTIKWPGRTECLRRHRHHVQEGFYKTGDKAGQPKYKLYWKCAKCKKDFRNESDVQVDHIEEVGGFKGDFDVWIKRLYCGQENLQCLCLECHQKKTAFNAAEKLERNKKSGWSDL